MLWKQYEKKIVERLGVHLVGWPPGLPFDVEKLKEEELKTLNDALNDGSCRWEEVPTEEMDNLLSTATRNENQPRKTRSDAGKKKRRSTEDIQNATKRPRIASLHTVEDSSDDDDASSSPARSADDDSDETVEKET